MMSDFKEILASLPSVDHLEAIELTYLSGESELLSNQPGKAGSLAVYNALLEEVGEINAVAAQKGLELFAEHTEDARANPGKHPNIDRLRTVISGNGSFTAKRIQRDS